MGGTHLMELATLKMLGYCMQYLQAYREAGACWHLGGLLTPILLLWGAPHL